MRLKATLAIIAVLSLVSGVVLAFVTSAHATPAGAGGEIAFHLGYSGGVHVMDASGSNRKALLGTATQEPAWSPDGSRVAYVLNDDLWVANADGTGAKRITKDSWSEREPTWSPDGKKIAYTWNGATSWNGSTILQFDIHIVDADGSNLTKVTTDPRNEMSPAWSPDGTSIAFVRDTKYQTKNSWGSTYWAPNYDVWAMKPDGTGQKQLTFDIGYDEAPAWSPDGTKLAFVSDRHDPKRWHTEIYAMSANGTGQHRVSYLGGTGYANQGSAMQPVWSPDGNQIMFVRDADLYVMTAAGNNAKNLTNTPTVEEWSPDWRATFAAYEPPLVALLPPSPGPADLPEPYHGPFEPAAEDDDGRYHGPFEPAAEDDDGRYHGPFEPAAEDDDGRYHGPFEPAAEDDDGRYHGPFEQAAEDDEHR